jgi:hypothetical protein
MYQTFTTEEAYQADFYKNPDYLAVEPLIKKLN